MSGKHGLSLITAVVLLICLHYVLADTKPSKPSGGPPAPRNHRSTGNVEFIPSVSRTLPSTRIHHHHFDRNAPASRRSHHARRVASGKPPPYAVQMEPLFQYSQRDPLYQESGVDKNKDSISKKFSSGPGVFVNNNGAGNLVSPYQSNFYVTPQPDNGYNNHNNYNHYNYHDGNIPPGYIILKEPEPIIEIIVKEANHTLPPPIAEPTTPKPREPVHVFFVKYKKDAHGNGVQYDKPVPAVTPATPLVSEPVEAPGPVYNTPLATIEPPPSTTLRTVIHPDSETVHINTGGLRISFGEERNHGEQYQQSEGQHDIHHHEGSEPQPTFAKTPSPPVQHAQPSAQVQQHVAPVQAQHPVQHHTQPTKRQQPRFHAAPFQQPAFGTEPFQPSEQNRFLSPPPVQALPPQQFNPNFPTPSQDRQQSFPPFSQRPSFSPNRNQPPFQQAFDSPSFPQPNNFQSTGKLEAVPFKQPSTGKIELGLTSGSGRFESNSFNQPPAFPSFRVQEPINGLPPPPPPQSFPRQSSSFFQQPQFNPRPQAPRPVAPQFTKPAPFPPQPASFPQQVASFPQPGPPNTQHTQQPPFSQPLGSAPQQAPKFSQPLSSAPQQAPKFSQPLASPQQPSFSSPQQPSFSSPQQPSFSSPGFSSPAFSSFTSPPQNSFSFVPPFSRFPESSTPPSTTTQQVTQPTSTTQKPPSFESEIVQSISPSAEELQRQQQEQFQQEQLYYQEIQKLQKELELRAQQEARSTTKKPSGKNPVFAASTTTTTTTTEAPRVETPASNASAPNLSNFVLPDEVPDDLRQQLLSSGILSNADIQILDYDKVGDVPFENLPQEALQQFIGAGGGGAVGAGSAPVPQYVHAPVKRVSTDAEDSAAEASERVETKSPVEMKVVRYAPGNERAAANQYVRSDATTLDPVVLNDDAYSRYLPLQVAGARFPLPDVPELRGRNVTSVVVLAPVAPAVQTFARRSGHVAETQEEDVQFVAGPILKELVSEPTEDNFKRWLRVENSTAANKQSIILLVADKDASSSDSTDDENNHGKDIFMYDVTTQQVSKLRGELSSAFVEVALANSGSTQGGSSNIKSDTKISEKKPSTPSKTPSNHAESYVKPTNNKVTISTSYSKTKQ